MVSSRVRDIASLYGLGWLLRQETAHAGNLLERLNDEELRSLLNTMERAREACDEEIPLHELGLIRRTIRTELEG